MSDGRYKKNMQNSHRDEWRPFILGHGWVSSRAGSHSRELCDCGCPLANQEHKYTVSSTYVRYTVYVRKLLFHSAVCPAKFALSHKRPMCLLSELISRVFLYSILKRKQFCVIHVGTGEISCHFQEGFFFVRQDRREIIYCKRTILSLSSSKILTPHPPLPHPPPPPPPPPFPLPFAPFLGLGGEGRGQGREGGEPPPPLPGRGGDEVPPSGF